MWYRSRKQHILFRNSKLALFPNKACSDKDGGYAGIFQAFSTLRRCVSAEVCNIHPRLFTVTSVRCHGYVVEKPASQHLARLLGRDVRLNEKPTFLVWSWKTPTFKLHKRLGYQQVFGYAQTSQHWPFQEDIQGMKDGGCVRSVQQETWKKIISINKLEY